MKRALGWEMRSGKRRGRGCIGRGTGLLVIQGLQPCRIKEESSLGPGAEGPGPLRAGVVDAQRSASDLDWYQTQVRISWT